jgi:hypothetical protein
VLTTTTLILCILVVPIKFDTASLVLCAPDDEVTACSSTEVDDGVIAMTAVDHSQQHELGREHRIDMHCPVVPASNTVQSHWRNDHIIRDDACFEQAYSDHSNDEVSTDCSDDAESHRWWDSLLPKDSVIMSRCSQTGVSQLLTPSSCTFRIADIVVHLCLLLLSAHACVNADWMRCEQSALDSDCESVKSFTTNVTAATATISTLNSLDDDCATSFAFGSNSNGDRCVHSLYKATMLSYMELQLHFTH